MWSEAEYICYAPVTLLPGCAKISSGSQWSKLEDWMNLSELAQSKMRYISINLLLIYIWGLSHKAPFENARFTLEWILPLRLRRTLPLSHINLLCLLPFLGSRAASSESVGKHFELPITICYAGRVMLEPLKASSWEHLNLDSNEMLKVQKMLKLA